MSDQSRSTPIRVLLVEDNEHDRLAFKRALGKAEGEFEVTHCDNSESAMALLGKRRDDFDLVVVDYNLPGRNGLTFFVELKDKLLIPPFVMLTGTGSETLAVDALKAGMYDYIIKDPDQGYLKLLPLKLSDVRQRHLDRQARIKHKRSREKARRDLKIQVRQRTADLAFAVEALQQEVEERRQAEAALRASQVKLRHLSVKIVTALENDRKRLAKELHDSIGGSLAAIKFAVEERLVSMKSGPPKDIVSLERIVSHILDTIEEVRRISANLRPSMLDDFGLLATVQWYIRECGKLSNRVRINLRFEVSEDHIPDFHKIVIYRVLQEAVNNAYKHSDADLIEVVLRRNDHGTELSVTDNGCGFDTKEVLKPSNSMSGLGLTSMCDRAEISGGRLDLISRKGEGSTVRLVLPDSAPFIHSGGMKKKTD